MVSRRKLLALAGGGVLGTGLWGGRRKSGIQVAGRFTTDESVFVDPQESDRYFRASVFESSDDAVASLNTAPFEVNGHWDVLKFDDRTQFLAVLVSRSGLLPSERLEGWCPEGVVEGDQFVFRLPLAEGETDPTLQDERTVAVEVWNRQPARTPSTATVDVRTVSATDDIRTCGEATGHRGR